MYSLLQAFTEHEKETGVVVETPLVSIPSFFLSNPPSPFYNVRAWNRLLDLRDMDVSKIEAVSGVARAIRKWARPLAKSDNIDDQYACMTPYNESKDSQFPPAIVPFYPAEKEVFWRNKSAEQNRLTNNNELPWWLLRCFPPAQRHFQISFHDYNK